MTADPYTDAELDTEAPHEAFERAWRHVPMNLYDEDLKPAHRAFERLLATVDALKAERNELVKRGVEVLTERDYWREHAMPKWDAAAEVQQLEAERDQALDERDRLRGIAEAAEALFSEWGADNENNWNRLAAALGGKPESLGGEPGVVAPGGMPC